MRTTVLVLIMSLGMFQLGCGGGAKYDGSERVPVSGRVTLDGTPVERGVMNFKSIGGMGRMANAEIANGEYSIPEAQGPNVGEYSVEIMAHREVPGAQPTDPHDPHTVPTEQYIPAKYNTNTELKVEFTSGKNEENFELQSN